jgi:hypothetical protein
LTGLTTNAAAVGLTQNLMVAPITGPYMTLSKSNLDVPEPCEKSADEARKSNVAIDRDAVGHTEQPVVGGNSHKNWLPAPKPPTVAAEHDLLARCQLLPHTCANERINPIDGTGFRNRAISGYGDTEGAVKRHGARPADVVTHDEQNIGFRFLGSCWNS